MEPLAEVGEGDVGEGGDDAGGVGQPVPRGGGLHRQHPQACGQPRLHPAGGVLDDDALAGPEARVGVRQPPQGREVRLRVRLRLAHVVRRHDNGEEILQPVGLQDQVDVALGGAGPDGQEDAGARQGGDELRGAGERGGRMPGLDQPHERLLLLGAKDLEARRRDVGVGRHEGALQRPERVPVVVLDEVLVVVCEIEIVPQLRLRHLADGLEVEMLRVDDDAVEVEDDRPEGHPEKKSGKLGYVYLVEDFVPTCSPCPFLSLPKYTNICCNGL